MQCNYGPNTTRVKRHVWSGERCEEWTRNNVQCEPLELREIVNFACFTNGYDTNTLFPYQS